MFCQTAIPNRTGPHAVGTARLKMRTGEGRRQRSIVVQLWYPVEGAKASARARGLTWLAKFLHPTWAPAYHRATPTTTKATFPFIAYLPDAHGHHDDNTFTLANLASHGFVLAAIDDPYRNGKADVGAWGASLHQSSNGVADPAAAHYARRIARGIAAASALLDALKALKTEGPGSVWAGRLDLEHVGILGYAMGGDVAAEAPQVDPRFAAAGTLGGSLGSERHVVKVPYLLMLSDFSMPSGPPSATPDHGTESPSRLPAYRRAQRQAALPESHVIEVAGTRREHFSDKLIFPSRLFAACRQIPGAKRIRAIIDSYTVAFFTTYLQTEPHPLMCVRHSPYPEVRFVSGGDESAAWALQEPAGKG
jgi:dienelactone hydrolase